MLISSTNTGLSPRLHPRKSCSFVLSWSAGASATRTLKAQDPKRTFKANFPKFPAVRPKAKFFEPRQIWYQNAYPPNSIWISKIIGFLGKHPCLTRYCAFSLLDSPEIARIFFVNKSESVLELSITLPIPAKHSLTYLNKAAEEILQESKPPILLDDTYFQSYLKKDVRLRNPITGT